MPQTRGCKFGIVNQDERLEEVTGFQKRNSSNAGGAPSTSACPPLQVQVTMFRPGGVGDGAVDGVQGLVLHLGATVSGEGVGGRYLSDGITVQCPDRYIHIVSMGVQA